jgi:hypothetical protein
MCVIILSSTNRAEAKICNNDIDIFRRMIYNEGFLITTHYFVYAPSNERQLMSIVSTNMGELILSVSNLKSIKSEGDIIINVSNTVLWT